MADMDPHFKTTLRDVLYNFHPTSGASDDYCKGLINGVVCTLMGCQKLTFRQSVEVAVANMPWDARRLDETNIPNPWLGTVLAEFEARSDLVLRSGKGG